MGKGKVCREGILCSCCSRHVTVGEFEIYHSAGGTTGKPYRHIVLEGTNMSLLDCQIEELEIMEELRRRRKACICIQQETA